jgi:hypothetical protein
MMEGMSDPRAEYSDPAVDEQEGDHEAKQSHQTHEKEEGSTESAGLVFSAQSTPPSPFSKTLLDAQLVASNSNTQSQSSSSPATNVEPVDGLRFGITDLPPTAKQQRTRNTFTIKSRCQSCRQSKQKVPITQGCCNVCFD